MNNAIKELSLTELVDLWIDAIPDDPYAPCPCGCGKKFKFVKDEAGKHEEQFYKNIINQLPKG